MDAVIQAGSRSWFFARMQIFMCPIHSHQTVMAVMTGSIREEKVFTSYAPCVYSTAGAKLFLRTGISLQTMRWQAGMENIKGTGRSRMCMYTRWKYNVTMERSSN